ncbi:stage II sporulation protein M [uncultured Methanofollis sp.]|uniref:stage II sporulation protein M n=1 Tax=uncultured Methanofollis sp. TaxID=262500 RepID=UPI002631C88B|nr:stage II sporulation protein M [uncultured Methanofollis sp.]
MSRREFLPYLVGAVVIFAVGIVAGYGVSASGDPAADQILDAIMGGVFSQILGDNPLMLAVKIFLNNLQACVLLFLGGATFGLLTFFILFSNGLVIGLFADQIAEKVGPLGLIAGLVPHGVFELPAIFIAAALGLALARSVLADARGQGDAAADAARLGGLFLRVVVPLLAVAAVIEAFITPALLQIVV